MYINSDSTLNCPPISIEQQLQHKEVAIYKDWCRTFWWRYRWRTTQSSVSKVGNIQHWSMTMLEKKFQEQYFGSPAAAFQGVKLPLFVMYIRADDWMLTVQELAEANSYTAWTISYHGTQKHLPCLSQSDNSQPCSLDSWQSSKRCTTAILNEIWTVWTSMGLTQRDAAKKSLLAVLLYRFCTSCCLPPTVITSVSDSSSSRTLFQAICQKDRYKKYWYQKYTILCMLHKYP